MATLGVHVQILRAGEDVDAAPPTFTRKAITFLSLDLDTIALHRPERLAFSLEKAMSMLSEEFTPSANIKCMAVSQIEDTLAESQKPKAPEKIVLTADADT